MGRAIINIAQLITTDMDPSQAARKIRSMEIRGALKIGLTAAGALKEYAKEYVGDHDEFLKDLKRQGAELKRARPTAVSLPNAVDYVIALAGKTGEKKELIRGINKFLKEQKGALDKVADICSKRIKSGDVVLTHCNSTAVLESIKAAHARGKKISVVCTETRPRHQGYLTAKFMARNKIPVTLVIDSAARWAMEELDVDRVIIGADTITANGSVVNKIGTSQIALAAHESNIPVICACETLKFSPETLEGVPVEIEEREHAEIRKAMRGVKMANPAFDITPPEYIDEIVTEDGVISPYMAYEVLRDKFGKKFGD